MYNIRQKIIKIVNKYIELNDYIETLDLSELEITDSELSFIVDYLNEKLPNLFYLDLSYNKITDISALAKIVNLTHLNLSYNPITNILPLSNIIKLKQLELHFHNITDMYELSKRINSEMYILDKIDLSKERL